MKTRTLYILLSYVITYIIRSIFRVRTRLSAAQKKQLQSAWQKVEMIQEPTKKIIEAEKVLVHALRALGYTGTFANQWKRAQARFGFSQSVWRAHTLRNRVVHDVNCIASQKDADFVFTTYRAVLHTIWQ